MRSRTCKNANRGGNPAFTAARLLGRVLVISSEDLRAAALPRPSGLPLPRTPPPQPMKSVKSHTTLARQAHKHRPGSSSEIACAIELPANRKARRKDEDIIPCQRTQ